jgi:hypothetical protein
MGDNDYHTSTMFSPGGRSPQRLFEEASYNTASDLTKTIRFISPNRPTESGAMSVRRRTSSGGVANGPEYQLASNGPEYQLASTGPDYQLASTGPEYQLASSTDKDSRTTVPFTPRFAKRQSVALHKKIEQGGHDVFDMLRTMTMGKKRFAPPLAEPSLQEGGGYLLPGHAIFGPTIPELVVEEQELYPLATLAHQNQNLFADADAYPDMMIDGSTMDKLDNASAFYHEIDANSGNDRACETPVYRPTYAAPLATPTLAAAPTSTAYASPPQTPAYAVIDADNTDKDDVLLPSTPAYVIMADDTDEGEDEPSHGTPAYATVDDGSLLQVSNRNIARSVSPVYHDVGTPMFPQIRKTVRRVSQPGPLLKLPPPAGNVSTEAPTLPRRNTRRITLPAVDLSDAHHAPRCNTPLAIADVGGYSTTEEQSGGNDETFHTASPDKAGALRVALQSTALANGDAHWMEEAMDLVVELEGEEVAMGTAWYDDGDDTNEIDMFADVNGRQLFVDVNGRYSGCLTTPFEPAYENADTIVHATIDAQNYTEVPIRDGTSREEDEKVDEEEVDLFHDIDGRYSGYAATPVEPAYDNLDEILQAANDARKEHELLEAKAPASTWEPPTRESSFGGGVFNSLFGGSRASTRTSPTLMGLDSLGVTLTAADEGSGSSVGGNTSTDKNGDADYANPAYRMMGRNNSFTTHI